MTQNRLRTRMAYGAGLMTLSLVIAGPAWSSSSAQSTGPGVTQGEDDSMSTKQGGKYWHAHWSQRR
jgi:hypothetical protein